MNFFETTDMLVSRLDVAPGAPYEVVAQLSLGALSPGQIVHVYGQSHGNPRQHDQTELAWVTGIGAEEAGAWKYNPCWFRGNDLRKNRKRSDTHAGAFLVTEEHSDLKVLYRMRAVNLVAGGYLDLSWARLTAVVQGAP